MQEFAYPLPLPVARKNQICLGAIEVVGCDQDAVRRARRSMNRRAEYGHRNDGGEDGQFHGHRTVLTQFVRSMSGSFHVLSNTAFSGP